MPGGPTIQGARVYELATFADACFRAADWYAHDSEDADRGRHLARQLASNGLWALEQAVDTYNSAADAAEKRIEQLNDQIRTGRLPGTDGPVNVTLSTRPPGIHVGNAAVVAPRLRTATADDDRPALHQLTADQLDQFDRIDQQQADRLDADQAF